MEFQSSLLNRERPEFSGYSHLWGYTIKTLVVEVKTGPVGTPSLASGQNKWSAAFSSFIGMDEGQCTE